MPSLHLATLVSLLLAIAAEAAIPVVDVAAGEEGRLRGVETGDQLIHISLHDDSLVWQLTHPFDLVRAEVEAAGRPADVTVANASGTGQLRLAARTWGIRGGIDGATNTSENTQDTGDSLLARAESLQGPAERDRAWFYVNAAERFLLQHDGRGEAQADAAWAKARRAALPADLPLVIFMEASAQWDAERFDRAERNFGELVQVSQGVFRVRGMVGQARAQFRKRDLPACRERLEAALTEIQKIAPRSLEASRLWQRLGNVALQYRNADDAETNFKRAFDISNPLAPQSAVHAETLRGMGFVAILRGDSSIARDHIVAALALLQRRSPESLQTARAMSNLGIAYWQLGDLRESEQWQRRALAITETIQPGGVQHGGLLNNLGLVFHRRRQFDAALEVYQQAANIFAKRSPDSLEYARGLTNVALAQGLGGNSREALETLDRVLAIQSAIDPDATDVVQTQHGIGLNHQRLDELDEAEAVFRSALRGWQHRLPGSLSEGYTLQSLGQVLRQQGQYDEALGLLEEALAIMSALAPGTSSEAKTLFEIAEVHREMADTALATEAYERALAALTTQLSMLGGDDMSRAHFLEQFSKHYKNYILMHLASGDDRSAFEVLEAYRAQSLRAMLAERPKAMLRNQTPEQVERQHAYDRLLTKLSALKLGKAYDEERAELLIQLEQMRTEGVADNSAHSGTRAFDALAGSIAPGTLVLSYCVTDTETILFVLSRNDKTTNLQVHRLRIDGKELTAAVRRLRVLIRAPNAGETTQEAMVQLAAELGEQLLGPARESIMRASNMLIIADGPLHTMSFSALRLAVNDSAVPRYLIEHLPVQNTLSLTLLSDLVGRNNDANRLSLVAFGDPLLADSKRPLESADGVVLPPLPYARAEAQSVAEKFSDSSRYFVGAEATESTARFQLPETRIAHFATHAVLDPRSPLESYLLLGDDAETGTHNGLLQGWEIIEQVSMIADLVTLAACETGLGRSEGGEGLIGLTRAFQHAGARNVLSTLWAVADEPSQLLMERFYAALAAGEGIPNALRTAQLSLLHDNNDDVTLMDRLRALVGVERTRSLAHPYYWAGYQLNGAWAR